MRSFPPAPERGGMTMSTSCPSAVSPPSRRSSECPRKSPRSSRDTSRRERPSSARPRSRSWRARARCRRCARRARPSAGARRGRPGRGEDVAAAAFDGGRRVAGRRPPARSPHRRGGPATNPPRSAPSRSAVRAREKRATGKRPVEEREAGSVLGTGRGTGDLKRTVFAFDTDYDVHHTGRRGAAGFRSWGWTRRLGPRRAGRRPRPALPGPRGPGGPEVEGSERRVSGKGSGE